MLHVTEDAELIVVKTIYFDSQNVVVS